MLPMLSPAHSFVGLKASQNFRNGALMATTAHQHTTTTSKTLDQDQTGVLSGQFVGPQQVKTSVVEHGNGCIDIRGHYEETDGKKCGILVRKADMTDIKKLKTWFAKHEESKSRAVKLKQYSEEELAKLVEDGDLYLATTDDGSLLTTMILGELSEEKKADWFSIGCISDNIAATVPELVFYCGGVKVDPGFLNRRGYLNNKYHLNLGAATLVEIQRQVLRMGVQQKGEQLFAVYSGTALTSTTTLHLFPTILKQFLRHKDFDLVRTICQEMTIPGSTEPALCSLAIMSLTTGGPETKKLATSSLPVTRSPTAGLTQSDDVFLSNVLDEKIDCYWMEHNAKMIRRGKYGGLRCDIVPRSTKDMTKILKYASASGVKVMVSDTEKGSAVHGGPGPYFRLQSRELRDIPVLDLANGVIVVEPGTTQGQVANLLNGTGWSLPVTMKSSNSSIIENALGGGMTSRGLQMVQSVGLEAVEWSGKTVKTGALASTWHGHGYAFHQKGGAEVGSQSFMFGNRGVVTKMAFALQRLPKYVGTHTTTEATADNLKKAQTLLDEGLASWWQYRVDPMVGVSLVLSAQGKSKSTVAAKLEAFQDEVGEGQMALGTSNIDSSPNLSGKGPFPPGYLQASFQQAKGVPSEYHCKGSGLTRSVAYAAPPNPALLTLIRDEMAKSSEPGVAETITMMPMNLGNTVCVQVEATFEQENVGAADAFFNSVKRIMSTAKCPPLQ